MYIFDVYFIEYENLSGKGNGDEDEDGVVVVNSKWVW